MYFKYIVTMKVFRNSSIQLHPNRSDTKSRMKQKLLTSEYEITLENAMLNRHYSFYLP